MPSFPEPPPEAEAAGEITFPPVSRDHILHCSYDYWFPKYRNVCIKSRIIPLPQEFVDYLREDCIILSDEGHADDDDDDWEPSNPTMRHYKTDDEKRYDVFLDDDDDTDDDDEPAAVRLPPNRRFPAVHQQIKDEIAALGGVVAPKLNWSAPKDAAELMEQKNTMRCRTPDDVYFMLKSSSFVSHDLEHALDGTYTPPSVPTPTPFRPVLVLRAYFEMHTALEFRCFVKHRNLVAITPRDLRHYAYLERLRTAIVDRARTLFTSKLQFTFPEGSFCFDIYIPETDGQDKGGSGGGDGDGAADSRLSWARLIDINPWDARTDTLLFGWDELLRLEIPRPFLGIVGESGVADIDNPDDSVDDSDLADDDDSADDDDDQDYPTELRLVEKDDPASANFSAAPYSAHKLPKEVVDASMAGEGGLREFAHQWQQLVQGRQPTPSSAPAPDTAGPSSS